MSRYPDNPLWHHERDIPIAIFTRKEWDDALAAGYITADHVIARLHNIAVREFGRVGAAGYDEDGFFTSLVADGLRMEGGVTLRVWSNDHSPPHVHVEIKGRPDLPIEIDIESGEVVGNVPAGWSKKIKGLQRAVRDNKTLLLDWWEKKKLD